MPESAIPQTPVVEEPSSDNKTLEGQTVKEEDTTAWLTDPVQMDLSDINIREALEDVRQANKLRKPTQEYRKDKKPFDDDRYMTRTRVFKEMKMNELNSWGRKFKIKGWNNMNSPQKREAVYEYVRKDRHQIAEQKAKEEQIEIKVAEQ